MDKNLLIGVLIGVLATLLLTAFIGITTYANSMMGWNHGNAMQNNKGHMHDHMQEMHDECEDMMHEHGKSTEHMS